MHSIAQKILVSCLALYAFNGCTAHDAAPVNADAPAPGIIGGTNVSLADVISSVTVKLLMKKGPDMFACTGTLISPNHILTAGHCLTGFNAVGILRADGTSVKLLSADIRVHPNFNPAVKEGRFDFAILYFTTDKPFTNYATVADKNSEPQTGADAIIAGYGQTSPQDEDADQTLHRLAVKISNLDYSASEVEIAEGANSGACHGDSGGPGYIISNGKVIVWGVDALNSRNSTADCFQFELYSRVSAVGDWIQKTIH